MLTFDPTDHVYRLDGEVIPSVTQVLTEVGMINGDWFTEYARGRGSAVHAACHYSDEGDLDEAELDPVIVPYLEAWKGFRAWFGQEWVEIEVPHCDPVLRYAGTPDRVSGEWITDIKTGADAEWHKIQLAAYDGLVPGKKRMTVRLDDRGGFHPKEWKDRNDWKIYLAALSVCHWKRRNNVR